MKNVVLRLSVVATASAAILIRNLRAQTLMRQITDQDPPPDLLFVQQWRSAIPLRTNQFGAAVIA